MKKLLFALILALFALTATPLLAPGDLAAVRAESTVEAAGTQPDTAAQAMPQMPAPVKVAAALVCLVFALIAVFPLFDTGGAKIHS